MPLSSEEAAKTLLEAENASKRSAELYFYHRSSPHLILWGVIWVIGYGGTGLNPRTSDALWAVLVITGILAGVFISRRFPRSTSTGGTGAWRLAGLGTIIVSFIFATYAILQPHAGNQLCAYPALITGAAYMAVGLWAGVRYVISGVAVAALTLFGFFHIDPQLYFYWMAVVGGGAMILTGIWFRRV